MYLSNLPSAIPLNPFSLIAFLMTVGGIYAAFQSKNLKAEDPWQQVNLDNIETGQALAK
jgi:hypothetical protein